MNTCSEHKVLIVDDEQPLCELLKLALARVGYSVFAAQTPESALEVMKAENCQVIFIDRILPGTDGYNLCHAIRSEYPGAVAYLLTGYIPEGEEAMWQEAGFANVFIKPVSLKILAQSVEEALHSRKASGCVGHPGLKRLEHVA
jgi:two-component system response regulator VicR